MPAPSTLRTRLFPLLFALALLPLVAVTALFYTASLRSVESVLKRQTLDAAQVAAGRLGAAFPGWKAETGVPAKGREVRAFFRARTEASRRNAEKDLELYVQWFMEETQGLYTRIVYLSADGDPLFKYSLERETPFALSPSDESRIYEKSDRRGAPDPGEKLRLTVVQPVGQPPALRFGRPIRDLRAPVQPPGYALVDVPLAEVLPQLLSRDVHLLLLDRGRREVLFGADRLSVRESPAALQSLLTEVLQAAGADSSGTLEFDLDGTGHLISFDNLVEPAWTLAAVVATDPYTIEPRRAGLFNLAVTGLFALVSGLSIFLLVRRVRQRTAALEAANREIQETTRRKSAFLASMSHDLRTPMNAIIGYTRILLRRVKDALEPRYYRNLENIEASSQNLLSLINEILDLSRIEAGRIEIKPTEVDLKALASECAASVAPLVRDGVEMKQDVQDVPSIYTDGDLLRRVAMNLLGNAVKFTEAGSITLSVRPVDGQVEISVADTGVGIPPEDLPYIFEEFRQVERGGAEVQGSGLGLAIVKKSVELLGGTIGAESEEGKGTTFILQIEDYSINKEQ